MSSNNTPKRTSKRPASDAEYNGSSNGNSKKPKNQSASSSPSDTSRGTIDDTPEFSSEPDTGRYEERQGILDDLESGSRKLIFECNASESAKCRASNCLVEQHPEGKDDKIRSRHRFNLRATNPQLCNSRDSNTFNRFYHVSCFEAIGIENMARYMTFPPAQALTRCDSSGFGTKTEVFHPAITEWAKNGGKAFDPELYEEFKSALKAYRDEVNLYLLIYHGRIFPRGEAALPAPVVPTKPQSRDFVSGDPPECSLTDVILRVFGAGDPLPLEPEIRIRLLEMLEEIPEEFSKASLAAREEASKLQSQDVGGTDVESARNEQAEAEKEDHVDQKCT